MFNLIQNRQLTLAVILAFVIQLFFVPSASAKWIDHSDELEGTDATPYLIAVGAVVVAAVVFIIVKKSSDGDDEKKDDGEENESSDASIGKPDFTLASQTDDGTEPLIRNTMAPRLGIYFGLEDNKNGYGVNTLARQQSNMTLQFGVSLGF